MNAQRIIDVIRQTERREKRVYQRAREQFGEENRVTYAAKNRHRAITDLMKDLRIEPADTELKEAGQQAADYADNPTLQPGA